MAVVAVSVVSVIGSDAKVITNLLNFIITAVASVIAYCWLFIILKVYQGKALSRNQFHLLDF